MYDMYDPNGSLVEWSAARSVRMRVLHQPLADLNIGYFEVGTSSVRASDVVPLLDDQAKGWRPWLDELLSVARSLLFCPRTLLLAFTLQQTIFLY